MIDGVALGAKFYQIFTSLGHFKIRYIPQFTRYYPVLSQVNHAQIYNAGQDNNMFIDCFRWWNGIGWRHKRSRFAASILTTSVPPPRWIVPPVSVSESIRGASGVIFYCDGQVWYWRGRAVEWCHTIIYGCQKNISDLLLNLHQSLTCNNEDSLLWSWLCSLPVRTQDNLQSKASNEWPEVYKAKPV